MSDEWWKLSDKWPFFKNKQGLHAKIQSGGVSFLLPPPPPPPKKKSNWYHNLKSWFQLLLGYMQNCLKLFKY